MSDTKENSIVTDPDHGCKKDSGSTPKCFTDKQIAKNLTVKITDKDATLLKEQTKHYIAQGFAEKKTTSTQSTKKKLLDTVLHLPGYLFKGQKDMDEALEKQSFFLNSGGKCKEISLQMDKVIMEDLYHFYELYRKFGEGGQGIISKAHDLCLQRSIAVKSLKPDLCDLKENRYNFIMEALITAQLEHPGIVPVYGLCTDKNSGVHIAMKLIRGQTLREYIDKICVNYDLNGSHVYNYKKARNRRIDVFVRACEAIGYAHSRNIMHCDLKPENIMIGAYHETYVMDWGIARLIHTDKNRNKKGSEKEANAAPNTAGNDAQDEKSDINGTPRYIPPEVFYGRHRDQRSDIYALGLILYELITLQSAFSGEGNTEIIKKVKNYDIKPIEHRYGVPIDGELKAIINKAIAFNPEDRYQKVEDFTEDLRRYQNREELQACPDDLFQKVVRWGMNHMRMVMMLVLVVSLIGVSSLAWAMYKELSTESVYHYREKVLNSAYTKLIHSGIVMDKKFGMIESVANTQAMRVGFMLESSMVDTASRRYVYSYEAFKKPEERPDHVVFSPSYGVLLAPSALVYQYPDGVSSKDVSRDIDRLAGILPCWMKLMFPVDQGFLLDREEAQRKRDQILVKEGLFVRWLYLGLANGLHLVYPGSGNYSKKFDVRTRNWYLQPKAHPDKFYWSAPYCDFGVNHEIILTGSRAIMSSDGHFLGAFGIDLSLQNIQNHFDKVGNNGEYVLGKYLITSNGDIVVQDGEAVGVMANDNKIVRMDKSDIGLKKLPNYLKITMAEEKYGFIFCNERFRDVVYVYTYIPSIDSFLMEKLCIEPMIEEFKRSKKELKDLKLTAKAWNEK